MRAHEPQARRAASKPTTTAPRPARSRRRRRALYGGHGAPATCVRFMADARHVLTSGGPDNTIFVWKHTVGQQKGARGAVKAAEPKGRRRGPGERRNILQGYADLLAKHDADGAGVIDFEEMRELVREDLRLATDLLPEARLARLFHKADAADPRHPGACSIERLAEFLLATGDAAGAERTEIGRDAAALTQRVQNSRLVAKVIVKMNDYLKRSPPRTANTRAGPTCSSTSTRTAPAASTRRSSRSAARPTQAHAEEMSSEQYRHLWDFIEMGATATSRCRSSASSCARCSTSAPARHARRQSVAAALERFTSASPRKAARAAEVVAADPATAEALRGPDATGRARLRRDRGAVREEILLGPTLPRTTACAGCGSSSTTTTTARSRSTSGSRSSSRRPSSVTRPRGGMPRDDARCGELIVATAGGSPIASPR